MPSDLHSLQTAARLFFPHPDQHLGGLPTPKLHVENLRTCKLLPNGGCYFVFLTCPSLHLPILY